MAIYWLKAGDTGAVKVGYAVDVAKRVKLLQCGAPYPLILLRQEPGDRAMEAALHRHYRTKHLRLEWYALNTADVNVDLATVARKPAPGPLRPKPFVRPEVARAIQVAGGGAALAKACGVRKEAVQQWKSAGIPPLRAQQVAAVTKLPLHEIRPDIYPAAQPVAA
jgi:hypothetical protein